MNNGFLDVRRRALEEEYFAKVNRVLLERLRAADAADARSRDGSPPGAANEDASPGEPVHDVIVRRLRSDDVPRYGEFVARIDARDRRLRFGEDADVPAALVRLLETEDDVTFIAARTVDGSSVEIIGDARARIAPYPYASSAEFGVVVRSDLQRLGLGKSLLKAVVEGCRARGVELLYGVVAPSNSGMLALARALGFEVDHVEGTNAVIVSLHLRRDRRRAARGEATVSRGIACSA